jgi:hypothetical protein
MIMSIAETARSLQKIVLNATNLSKLNPLRILNSSRKLFQKLKSLILAALTLKMMKLFQVICLSLS